MRRTTLHGRQPTVARPVKPQARDRAFDVPRVQPLLGDTAGDHAHEDEDAGHEEEPASATDPHVWLDPLRFALVARRIGSALNAPEQAEKFAARLRALDRHYRRGLAHCDRHEIVTSHEAVAYLAERYELRQIAICL